MQGNQHASQQNLYEIPHCTICLTEMTEQLANLSCGHVFHITCITQHFQYRGTCPNCQKRSHQKEIRPVVFPMQKNTQAAQLMRQVLGNLSIEQKQQVQVLFKQVQSLTEKNQKLQNTSKQAEKQLKKSTQQLNESKLFLNRKKTEYEELKRDSLQLKKVIDHLQHQIRKLNEQNFNLRHDIQQYKDKQADYEQVRKYKKIMYENSQALIDYRKQLQSKNTSASDMAARFFDMILIKNLQVIKLKNKLQGHPEKLLEKEQHIDKLKSLLEREKREVKDLQEKRSAQKKKYDDLKFRYKNLIEKYKAKCQEMSDEENYEDSMVSRPSFPMVHSVANNNKVNNNMNGSIFLNNSIDENSSSNIPFVDTKINKRGSSNMFSSIIEEEPSSNATQNNQQQYKKPVQQSLNTFITQKPTQQNSYGTYGGIGAKKKVEDNKKPAMKNLFS